MKYYVRTTKERTFNYDLDYVELVDTEHKPIKSFIEQLEIISKTNAVLLEDDLILCKDFKQKIENAIKEHPKKIINFFESPFQYYKTEERKGKQYYWNQCTYYPRGVGKKLAKMMKKVWKEYPEEKNYDIIMAYALDQLNMTYISYRPCLVQHLDKGSLIGESCGIRTTIYFDDYLNELGINYNQQQIGFDDIIKLQKARYNHLCDK
jgi:GR25 family glycosyltransferase involved in LPS biosynthesis